jgi:hypothetical protein
MDEAEIDRRSLAYRFWACWLAVLAAWGEPWVEL